MYYVRYQDPGSGQVYRATARTKSDCLKRVRYLQNARIPMIVVMWDNAPLAFYARTSRGNYKVWDWD